jgi:hypothetical protein
MSGEPEQGLSESFKRCKGSWAAAPDCTGSVDVAQTEYRQDGRRAGPAGDAGR